MTLDRTIDLAAQAEEADREREAADRTLAHLARAAMLRGIPLQPTGLMLEMAQESQAAEQRAQWLRQQIAGGAR